MADLSFHDDRDFTRCKHCASVITPYDNTSLTRLSNSLDLPDTTVTLTTADLAATSAVTATLLSHHKLSCAKCGLYVDMHPARDQEPALSAKLFICPQSEPHSYCLCHHCGLLYGVNPNPQTQPQLTIDALRHTLSSKLSLNTKRESKLESELEKNVIDEKSETGAEVQAEPTERDEHAGEVDEEEGDHSSSEVSASKECVVANYHNERLQRLERKLNELSSITLEPGRASWPPSPSNKSLSLNLKDLKDSPSATSAATPSPPYLEIRDSNSSRKWRQLQQEQAAQGVGTKRKLKAQSQRLQELEEMQRRMSRRRKVEPEQLRKLLRSGKYKNMNSKK